MSRLDDLITSVDQMSDEKLLDLVREVRRERGIRKPRKTPSAASVEKKKDTLKGLLKALPADELKALLGKMKK